MASRVHIRATKNPLQLLSLIGILSFVTNRREGVMRQLTIKTETKPHESVVMSLVGTADIDGLESLEKELLALSAKKPKLVVFDATHLKFIASLSIGALIHFRRKCLTWGGKVAIAGANENIANALHHVRVDTLLPLSQSVEAALAHPPGK
jgi:anti-anti-sigma factor